MTPVSHFPVYGTDHFFCGTLIPANPVYATSEDFNPCPDCAAIIRDRTAMRETVQCPECGDDMLAARAQPGVLSITRAVCSECNVFPARERERIERERRVAAFGEGRC